MQTLLQNVHKLLQKINRCRFVDFQLYFKDSLWLEWLTNLNVKCDKRSVKIWTINLWKCFFKNILSYINGWLSKICLVQTFGVSYIIIFASFCMLSIIGIWLNELEFRLLSLWNQFSSLCLLMMWKAENCLIFSFFGRKRPLLKNIGKTCAWHVVYYHSLSTVFVRKYQIFIPLYLLEQFCHPLP